MLLRRGESPCTCISQQDTRCVTTLLIHCGNDVICRKMYSNYNKYCYNNIFSHSSKLQSPCTNIHSKTFFHFIPAMYYNKHCNNNIFSHSHKLQSPRTNIHSQTFFHSIPAMYYNKHCNNNIFSHSYKLQSPHTNIHSQTFFHSIPASSFPHPHLVFMCLLVDCVSDQQLVH